MKSYEPMLERSLKIKIIILHQSPVMNTLFFSLHQGITSGIYHYPQPFIVYDK